MIGTWMRFVTLALAALGFAAGAFAAPAQQAFATPDEAVAALVAAVKANDARALRAVLGYAGATLSSGDKVADRAATQGFVAEYDAKHSIARDGDTAKLIIGKEDFPFAFPLVKKGDQWRFDTASGIDELNARRIGENELSTIKVLQAIVDAQREYAAEDLDGDGVAQYARRLISSPGKRDGLYWPVKAGEKPSPLGQLVAGASAEGYGGGKKAGPRPFHGYYFRALKGQAASAGSAAYDYVVQGRAIGGFAVIAYPAKYGSSGIMTFMVNQDGKVFQADLGPSTQAKASAMQKFDPGKGWSPVSP
ncbi:MAG: DUF2950 domain-containing protein [Burkholderiales bacterium]|nr:DUF2950 domain-containing protein [Burkholderiales bacterium]